MKLRLLFCAAALAATALTTCTAPNASAQAPPHPAAQAQPGPPQPMAANDPRNILHLSPAQQKKAIAINQQFLSTVQSINTDKALTDADKREQFAGAQSSAQKHLMSILTPSQRTDLIARQTRQKEYMAGVAEDAKRVDALLKEFRASLTPAQKAKLNSLQQTYSAKIVPIQANKSLTPLQQGEAERAVAADYQKALKTVLNPKQVSEWQDIFRFQDEARSLERLAQETGL